MLFKLPSEDYRENNSQKRKKAKLPQNTELFQDYQLAMFKGKSHHFFLKEGCSGTMSGIMKRG